jgi:serine/threonine protein kinase/tetratricopeptide (TPR) repeat protein
MNRKKRLDKLIFEAFERPVAEQRAFLQDACNGDVELLEEALALLAIEKDLGGFLEEPAFEALVHRQPEKTLAERPAAKQDSDRDPDAAAVEFFDKPTESAAPPSKDQPSAASGRDLTSSSLARLRLGGYEIVGKVGAGGMGQVYIGEDSRLGRQVAIKTLQPEIAEEPGWLERFKREARALATLNHPNIVTIHSIEEDDGVHFLTMELVDGKTLKEAIPEGGLPLEDLLRIATEITDALEAAHSRGVIHRDLKLVNVMLTSDGRAKVLDFGVAKVSGQDLTRPEDGMMLGTVSYMAPEQLQGGPVDSRADIFSFGIMLYMMATGKHPFAGPTSYLSAAAIMENEPQSASELRPDLPENLARIIANCLEKRPVDRYQNAAELRADLRSLQESRLAERLIESRGGLRPIFRRSRSRLPIVAASIVALLALIVALVWVWRPSPPATGASSQAERTTLTVLFFHNLTGDPESDWLATGITELLVTDISQSPQLRVLGTSNVHQILEEIGAAGKTELSPEMIRMVGEAGGAAAVLQGKYAHLGDVLRISFSIAEPVSGEVICSDSLEGHGEESLFSLVDQISFAVLECFHASRPTIGPATVKEATTDSLLAWQAYSEAQILYRRQSKPEQAIVKHEQAVAIDPDFALAFIDMARIHHSLGHISESQEYSQRAFELVDRLPLNWRFDVETGYYGARWATFGQAIETYNLALRVYPQVSAWRNNLARRYAFFEMYSKSIDEFRKLIGPGQGFWGNYKGAADAYAALGDFETGYQLLVDFTDKQSNSWRGHHALAWHLTEWGRFDEAEKAFDRVAELRPNGHQIPYGRWRLEAMRERWQQADYEARRLLTFDDSFARWRGPMALAQNALYSGNGEEALQWLDEAIDVSNGGDRALARCFKAELLLALGESTQALEQAEKAQTEGAEQFPELRGLYLAALAEQALDRSSAADTLMETLRERWLRQPNAVEERQLHYLSGLLALARGDMQEGLQELEQAAALLPANGVEFHWHVFPVHVPIWTDLGEAELAAGNAQKAIIWLRRVIESDSEHLEQPVSFVRCFYLKGIAHCRLGEHDDARSSFERFLGYWGSGDIDPDTVAAARAYVTAKEPPPPTPPHMSRWPEAGIR